MQQRASETRVQRSNEDILSAAAELFLGHGYPSVTMDNIVEHSNRSLSSIRRRFPHGKGLAGAAHALHHLGAMVIDARYNDTVGEAWPTLPQGITCLGEIVTEFRGIERAIAGVVEAGCDTATAMPIVHDTLAGAARELQVPEEQSLAVAKVLVGMVCSSAAVSPEISWNDALTIVDTAATAVYMTGS